MKHVSTLTEHLRESVAEKNFATLPFPLSYKELCVAMEHFFEFLALPLESKQKFRLYIDPDDPESMVGYMERKQKKGDLDEKEYFHYNRYAEAGFADHVKTVGEKATRFLNSAARVYEGAEAEAKKIIFDLEKEYPGIRERFLPPGVHPHFYLRFLKYSVQGKGNFLAGGHYDQGAFTLALAESAPGLRIGLNQSKLQAVEHHDGHAVFMPGLQLHVFTSDEFIPAWHDVVQRGEDVLSDDAARWSMVFFVDPVRKVQTTWEERHKPKY